MHAFVFFSLCTASLQHIFSHSKCSCYVFIYLLVQVAIAPKLRSRERNRNIINELFRSHKKYLDGRRSPAYDGRKGMFTAGELPFKNREFVVKIANDPERGNQG